MNKNLNDEGIDLLPCPFCGKPADIIDDKYIACMDLACGATVCPDDNVCDDKDFLQYSINQWNKRTKINE